MGQSPSSKNYTNNPNDWILIQGNADIENYRVKPRVWTTEITKIAEIGDIILSVRAPVGDVAKTDYKAVLGRGVASIRGNDFIFQLLGKMKSFGFWETLSTGSTFDSINSDVLKNATIFIPSETEQQAIGEFFKQLDDTIAFHQRTQKKYQNLKKSYLEKIFAKINYAWKQRKLGEVTVQIKSYSLSRNVETNKDTGFKYVHYGDIHRNIAKLLLSENNLPSIQKGNYEFLQKGDLVIADASEDYEGIGNSCLVDCFLSRNIVAGLHTIALRPTEVNSLFLYYLLHTDIFSQYGKIIATGTKVFGITAKNLLNFEFYLPTETEQQAIGEFFKQLDDTIAFHQRELEKYQQLKQVLLDQLFV